MRKKFLSIIVAIALVFTTVAQPMDALANGESARSNSFDTATSINFGEKYTGAVTENDGADYYKFVLNDSGEINLKAVAKNDTVTYRIYDADYELIWSQNVYINTSTGQSTFNKELDLLKGEYYFQIEEFYIGHNVICDYDFTITNTSANESFVETKYEKNDLLENSNLVKLNTKYRGQIAKNDDRDFYKFTIGSSGKITIVAESKMEEIDYSIYDIDGKELWSKRLSWNSNISLGVLNAEINLTKGTYYFRAGNSHYTGNYLFNLKFTSANESFGELGTGNNNTMDKSNRIYFDKRYKGQIALNDDKDFYKISVPKKQKIVVSINEETKNLLAYKIFNFKGEEVWDKNNWNWNSNSNTQTIELGKGTYYFLAYRISKYTDCGNYNFKFTSLAKPATPVMLSTQRVSSTNIKVRWKSVSGITGYKVYRSTTNKKGSYKLVKTVSSKYTYYKNSGLKKGRTYYWKVRAYKSASGEYVYSNFSKAVSGKTKS